jgi:hypothetical protein
MIAIFGTGGVGWLFIKQCQSFLVQWLKNRESRRVKIKYGDLQVEVTGRNDVDRILSDLEKRIPLDKSKPKAEAKQKEAPKPDAKPKSTRKQGGKGKGKGKQPPASDSQQ